MTSHNFSKPLITVETLAGMLDNPRLCLLDASWYLPPMQRDGRAEWQQRRIANAQHFDFDQRICDQGSKYPHMMPSAEHFTAEAQALGINQDSLIVVYDGMGLFSAPRARWMLRAMGHDNVVLLDGGLPAWEAAGHALNTNAPSEAAEGNFIAKPANDIIVDSQDVLAITEAKQLGGDADGSAQDTVIIDARPAGRFQGKDPEPRPGIRSGHIPGSVNLPFTDLLADGFLKSIDELKAELAALASPEQSLVMSCGSGVTACHLALAAELCGYDNVKVYDGSWGEWGLRDDLPIITSDKNDSGAENTRG